MTRSEKAAGIEGEGGGAKTGSDRNVSAAASSQKQQAADSGRHAAAAAATAGAKRAESSRSPTSPSNQIEPKVPPDKAPPGKAAKSREAKQPRTHEERWEESFQRLVAFHKKHGHCNIPYRCDEDPFLGRWVSLQRSIYKGEASRETASAGGGGESDAQQPGGERPSKSSATQSERVRRLNELGFEWSPQETRQVSWEQRYAELCDFVVRTLKTLSREGLLPGAPVMIVGIP
jgi:hypothetical protein